MENILKGIVIGAGVLITCVVISIGFIVFRESKQVSSSSAKKLSVLSSELSEHDLSMYEGLIVTGSDVTNFIKKQLGDYWWYETAPIFVFVGTSKSSNMYYNGACIPDIADFTKNNYINPISEFKVEVVRDKNKVIVGLLFKQK